MGTLVAERLVVANDPFAQNNFRPAPVLDSRISSMNHEESDFSFELSEIETSDSIEEPIGRDIPPEADPEADIPDSGWRAWLVVLGGFCANAITVGFVNSSGTVQEYISTHFLQDKSESDVGWIFSIYIFLLMFGGIQAGPMADTLGVRPLVLPGCVLWCASLVVLSFCREYYQFILGFSVLGGISNSLIFNPSFTILGQWFTTKKTVAMGIVAVGSTIVGSFLPVVLSILFDKIGYGWSIRALAFAAIALSIVACTTMKSRTKLSLSTVKWQDLTIELHSLKVANFRWSVFSLCLLEWATFLPSLYIVDYAKSVLKYSNRDSNLLLVYQNIGSTVGRISAGYFGGRLGPVKLMIFVTAMAGLSSLCIWLPAGRTQAGLIAFSVIFGFFSGAGMALGPACVASIATPKNFGKRYGTAYACVSVAVLTSLPLGGLMTDNDYIGMKLATGLVFFLSSACALMMKIRTDMPSMTSNAKNK